ncbi:tRNA synthetase class II core domain (G, H, P, S and T) [Amycolatopsis arida]|uniref:tRNA synthetase class II core domain (G, H, P, S and T) n=1 Tax=Amycolatopsis arida TaxID=587909 RepID=A0A1I5P2V3_9PSEU|nr:hypothetical protein [Amycolatopsis arida]TDX98320.1 tRNA synthetase class II (G, H, P, S and T) [Amycolatopsis arida]SFP27871.1 tRNA synthetase class II core domain (G, H, P, S and T) [Amycolatopsis arida]
MNGENNGVVRYVHRMPEGFAAHQTKLVADRLTYSVEGIHAIEPGAEPRELVVDIDADRVADLAVLDELADEVAGERLRGQRVVRRTDPAEPGTSAPARLDPVLHRALDLLFLDLCRAEGAIERAYPAVIERAVIDRCRYLALFPQNAYLVSELPHERALLARVRAGNDPAPLSRLSGYLLTPALCMHTYAEHADTEVRDPLAVTVIGQCFRHEASWRLSAHRVPSFTMREIVYLGDPGYVERIRASLMDTVWELFTELGLRGRLETASDPFYFAEDTPMRQFQLLSHAKYELVAELPGGETFAVASFNNVRDSLSHAFGVVDAAGAPVHSGCTGFGIERWSHAVRSMHGDDPRGWPAEIRRHCR